MTKPSEDRLPLFLQLFSRHQRHVYFFIRSLIHDPEAAEEIMQQCNMLLWQRFDQFEPGTNFRAWACQIAKFEVFNYRQRQNKTGGVQLNEEFFERVAAAAAEREEYFDTCFDLLIDCLGALSAKDRQLITRRYEAGMTSGRLAEMLNRPKASVYKSLSRIRAALLACVKGRLHRQEGPA